MKSNNILTIIPARSGSKRLKLKNIKLFNGKPLIYWTIKQALNIPNNNVIVSTDDKVIAEISVKEGASVPFLRPKYLSTDKATSMNVIKYIIKKLKFNGIVILLQPTSPLRNRKDILTSLSFIKDRKYNSIMSVYKFEHKSNIISQNKPPKPFKPINLKTNTNIFIPNGAIYIANSDWILKNTSFYVKETHTYEMPLERSVDIDYDFQFYAAETMFKKQKSNK